MTEINNREYKYFAFISYQRKDEKWAIWLQKQLENYKLPVNILKLRPDVPQYIRPVFRDKSDLCGSRLYDSLMDALGQSKFLIVICSPNSSNSIWVNNEVQYFIDNNRDNHIIPFIVDGTPNSYDRETECFPESISNLKGRRELLGIDINENGRDAALIKVISRITELNFDTLWQRYNRDLKKRKNLRALITSCIAILATIISLILYNQNSTINIQNRQLLLNQSVAVSDAVNRLVAEGDIYTAHKLVLEVLPDDILNPDRPLTTEAEYALRNSCWQKGGYLRGHTDRVYCAQMSHNGEFIVSGSDDNSIKIWDSRNGDCKYTLCGHKDRVYSVDISENDELVLSVSDLEKVIKVWNVEKGECVKTIDYASLGEVSLAKFYNNSQQIVTFIGQSVILWDIYSGDCTTLYKNVISEPTSAYGYCHIGPEILTIYNDNRVIFWNIHTSKLQRSKNVPFMTDIIAGNEIFIEIIPPSYMAHNDDFIYGYSTIKVYNINDGTLIREIASNKRFSIGVLSPDAKYLATASNIISSNKDYDSSIDIWDLETGLCVKTFIGHSVESISFSPCGQYVISSGIDRSVGVFYIGDRIPNLTIDNNVSSAQYSTDGRLVGYETQKEVLLYDINQETYKKIYDVEFHSSSETISSYGFSDDNNYYIIKVNMTFPDISDIRDTPIIVIDIRDNFRKEFYLGYSGYDNIVFRTSDIRLTKDNKYLFASISTTKCYGGPGTTNAWSIYGVCNDVIIWDFATGEKLHSLSGHTRRITSMIISRDDEYLYTASDDGTIRIWNVDTGECLSIIENDMKNVNDMVLTRNDDIIFSYTDKDDNGYISVLDIDNNSVQNIYRSDNTTLKIKSDEKYVAVYGKNTITLLSATDYSFISSITTPNDIWDVTLSPDGSYLATACFDGTTYIYAITNGGMVDRISNTGTSIEFSTISNDILTSDGNIYILLPLQTLINEAKDKYNGKSLTIEERKKYYLE